MENIKLFKSFRRVCFFAAIFFAVFNLIALDFKSAIAQETEKTAVTFSVKDNKQNSLSGATVEVARTDRTGLKTTCDTDARGACVVWFSSYPDSAFPPKDEYKVTAKKEGYFWQGMPITIIPLNTTSTVLRLEKETKDRCSECGKGVFNACDEKECLSLGNCVFIKKAIGGECVKKLKVTFRVLDYKTKAAISGASVKLLERDALKPTTACISGEDGVCGISLPPAEGYTVFVEAKDYDCKAESGCRQSFGLKDKDKDITLTLTPKKAKPCEDGTLHSQCSKEKPKYCNNGVLINKCQKCGCPENEICQPDGACKTTIKECKGNTDCTKTQFCEFPSCKEQTGKCLEKPGVCTAEIKQVCGCDGKTYSNDCLRKKAGVSKNYDGKCKPCKPDEEPCGGSSECCSQRCVDNTYFGGGWGMHCLACRESGAFCLNENYCCSKHCSPLNQCCEPVGGRCYFTDGRECCSGICRDNYCVGEEPQKDRCSECGKGVFNACNEKECLSLGKCAFYKNLLGGECLPKCKKDQDCSKHECKKSSLPFCYIATGKCSCKQGEGEEVRPDKPVSLEHKVGNMKVGMKVPAGALTESARISILPVGVTEGDAPQKIATLPSGVVAVGEHIYDYAAKAVATGQEIKQFNEPLMITITYTDAQIRGLNEDTLTIYYYDEATGRWVLLPTTVDKKEKTLSAPVNHFTNVIAVANPAGPVGQGGGCTADTECPPGGKCCCCPAGGCGTTNEPKGICGNVKCTNIVCPFSSHLSLEVLINKVVNWVFDIGIVLCPLMIVIGAFLFMTSAGEPKRTQLGKDILKWSIIGLAVILFAKGFSGIIRFIVVGQ